jgi:hypothetical protein
VVNKLITGIAQAIRKEFPATTYKVYTEKTEQGIRKPCFFILCVTQNHEARLKDRFRLESTFDIHYFPKNGNAEGWEVAEKLRMILEWITLDGDFLLGSNMNYKMEDGVLHFFVDYTLNMVHKKEPYDFMEEVKVYGKIRETGK